MTLSAKALTKSGPLQSLKGCVMQGTLKFQCEWNFFVKNANSRFPAHVKVGTKWPPTLPQSAIQTARSEIFLDSSETLFEFRLEIKSPRLMMSNFIWCLLRMVFLIIAIASHASFKLFKNRWLYACKFSSFWANQFFYKSEASLW